MKRYKILVQPKLPYGDFSDRDDNLFGSFAGKTVTFYDVAETLCGPGFSLSQLGKGTLELLRDGLRIRFNLDKKTVAERIFLAPTITR